MESEPCPSLLGLGLAGSKAAYTFYHKTCGMQVHIDGGKSSIKMRFFFFVLISCILFILHSSYLYHLLELTPACKYWKLITCISDRKSSLFLCFMLPVLFYHYSPVLKLITEMESIGDITCNYKVALYYETCKLDLISLSEALSTLALAMTLYIRTLKMILIISANVCLLEA